MGSGDSTESSRERFQTDCGDWLGRRWSSELGDVGENEMNVKEASVLRILVPWLAGGSHFAFRGELGRKRVCNGGNKFFNSYRHMPSESWLIHPPCIPYPHNPHPLQKKGVGELKNTWHRCKKAENVWQSSQASFPLGTKCFTVFVSPYRSWLLPSRLFETVGSEKRLRTAAGL